MAPSNPPKQKRKAMTSGFDEQALAQLTSTIAKSLPKPDAPLLPKRKRQNGPEDGPDSKRRQTSLPDVKPGKRGGMARKDNETSTTLLNEIIALGGDAADLELVANVDSGNEDEGTTKPKAPQDKDKPVDQSLQDELAKFALSLGFDTLPKDDDLNTDASASEYGTDNDATDGEGGAEEEEQEAEKEEEKGVKPAPPKKQKPEPVQKEAKATARETRRGELAGKLVSEQPRNDMFPCAAQLYHGRLLTRDRFSSPVPTGMASPSKTCLHLSRITSGCTRPPLQTLKPTQRPC